MEASNLDNDQKQKDTEQNTQTVTQDGSPKGATEQQKTHNKSGQQPDSGIFRLFAYMAPLFLLLLVALQAWPDFWQAQQGVALYCPAEAQQIQIAQEVAQSTQYYAPMTSLSAQWPLYTWLLLALTTLLPPALQWLCYPLAGACPAFLAIFAVWAMARAAGSDLPAALAAALALLCAPLFAPLLHFVGPAALASALMVLSLALFCRGWQAESAWLALAGGFLLAGLAGLAGGPFFLAVPLATSIVFLCWRCTFSRGSSLDAIFGFLLLLLLVGGWLGCVILFTHAERYIQELFGVFSAPWADLSSKWWCTLAFAVIGFLPWLAVVFCASWGRAIQTSWTNLKASRKEKAGASFTWFALAMGVALAIVMPEQSPQQLGVALLCLAAPLVGKSLMALSLVGQRMFVFWAMLFLTLLGAVLVAAYFEPVLDLALQHLPWQGKGLLRATLPTLEVLPVIGGGCILAALCMAHFFKRSSTIGGLLLYCSLIVTLLHQPAVLMLSPALGNIPEARLYRLQTVEQPVGTPERQQPTDIQETPPVVPPTENTEPQQTDSPGEV